MQPKSFLAFAGFVLLIAGTYCPLLKPFGIISWDLYGLNKPYGIVVLLVGIIGIAGIALVQRRVARIAAWVALVLVALVFAGAIFKVKTTFSFIPFKSVSGYLSRQIKFKWGWIPLFIGPLLSLLTIKRQSELTDVK